jgi:hypothetical protein
VAEAAPGLGGSDSLGREKTLTRSARPMIFAAQPMTPQADRLACPFVLALAGIDGRGINVNLPERAGNAEDKDDEMFGCR